ncbi:MAG: hypothetical protein ABS58_05950 [Mesorhizobium sp. SCN 65-20]|nr:MAG: hypothetical protein ABS58_05950 [Mesorhizobium sp. SCN 65-20]
MRVLITNLFVNNFGGSENVVELLADGLRRADHQPIVYAPVLGPQAEKMRTRGIRVVDRIGHVADKPDIIHGQHLTPCLTAMARFPDVPVVFASHSSVLEIEVPLEHPQIREVVAVDESCAARCRQRGVPVERLSVILNAVDLERFRRRAALPAQPKKALLLTKNAGHRAIVRTACAAAGLELDELGPGTGNFIPNIESVLGNYDIVFATARMALEAATTGCAVVVCDERGFAGMLTARDLAAWRAMNFGVGLLAHPVTPERVQAAIAQYDAADSAAVTDELRRSAGSEGYVQSHLEVYRRAIQRPAPSAEEIALATAYWVEELAVTTAHRKWTSVAREFGMGSSFLGLEEPPPVSAAVAALEAKVAELKRSLEVAQAEQAGFWSTSLDNVNANVSASLDSVNSNIAGLGARLDAMQKAKFALLRRLKQALIPRSLRTKYLS